MLMEDIKLAWQLHQQERLGLHQRFLIWTQAVLMIFVMTLSFTSGSIQNFLHGNLQNLLGADAVLSQKQSLTDTQYDQLKAMSERIVVTQDVSTTLTHNGKWQLIKLKGVGDGYPLHGELRTTDKPLSGTQSAVGEATKQGPEDGKIWVDARLMNSLGLSLGDQLTLSQHTFEVSRVLIHEPDQLMEGHNVDMRAMVSQKALSTLNFPDDIMQQRYLLEASNSQIIEIIQWQREQLPVADIVHKKGSHPLASFWKRAENLMGLASVILFFMAAIAIEQLTHVHIRKEKYFSALCMSLGASRRRGIRISVLKWLMAFVRALPFVLLLSALFYGLLINWLGDTFSGLDWRLSPSAVIQPLVLVFAMLLVFHLPVWLSLVNNSVAELIRSNNKEVTSWLSKGAGLLVLCLLVVSYSDNGLLTAMVLGSVLISIALILVLSWLGLTAGEKLTQNISGLIPFTFYMMRQRLVSKSTQILGIGLCAFLLLFTLMLLRDIGHTTSSYHREHNGNLLVSQASKEQMEHIHSWALQHDVGVRQSKPFVYAKLVGVNQMSLDQFEDKPSDSMATLKRSIRLHWSQMVPSNNRVVDGKWWREADANWQQVSVEEEIMIDLGLQIGDSLSLYIGQQTVEFTIVASHVYQAGGGSITFWMQIPPSALSHLNASHYSMASLELEQAQWPLLGELWQKYPTLRMVSLKEMTERFDTILKMVTQVTSGFSLLIILLASIVILATVQSLEVKEKKKNSVIMSFGFTKETCFKLNLIEWLITGGLAAAGAIFGTYIAGLLIYQSQFSLPYQPNFVWLASTLLLILSFVTALGVFASKRSLNTSIRELLADS